MSRGPDDGTGRTWGEYLLDEEAKRKVALRASRYAHTVDTELPDSDDEPVAQVTITTPGHEVESGWPKVLSTWITRLRANGWEFKVGFSEARHEDLFYKNGNLRKAAHDEQQWWINATKLGRYITISYNYENGKNVSTRTTRLIRGVLGLQSDAAMKEAIEVEDE